MIVWWTDPPAEPVGLEVPEPVAPSAMRRAEAEKQRGAATARALLMMDVRSILVVWMWLRFVRLFGSLLMDGRRGGLMTHGWLELHQL